ncbi:sugar ABC transporter ATP-binding protein [Labedaea rhizosphaerae]|uniref:Monosaccharide ABC transporter ATP-binding protein (CUT2 family) n=1 Tax=Labedaea rhizosphaerae TaxID=598644 RepID=A0A4R6SHD2_LABRH|nr:sugar ABC transporter ATP-binding protein [Labedaea rhizosphaerae]TDQ01033.1 monosaccharide ABC transporter ATP-binding protein (CUT2 family) [Labedaea rhizosphaerae]
MTEPVLEALGVEKRFAGVRALAGVDLTVRPGEVHALVGENGAGKSTLIKVLTGVYQPDAGELRYQGAPVRFAGPPDAQAAGIATVYQEVALVGSMSVASNLFLGREPRRFGMIDFPAMRKSAAKLLAELGIDVDPARELRTLGLGVQQMIAVARALHSDARVVIMDEPTSSLEPREVDTLLALVRTLAERDVAVVYVSHRMDELYRVCDVVTVLRDGAVVHTGPLAELDRVRLIATMLGRDIAEVRREGSTAFSGEHETEDEPVLAAHELRRSTVLDGVDLEVRPGEVVGLGGLLGSGRSETVQALAGLQRLDSGAVEVNGQPVRPGSAAAAIRAGIVLVPEDRKVEGLVPNLSVRENIVLAALPRLSRLGVVSRAKQDAVVRTFMERLQIKASSPDQRVSELSGGNQQKVMLARWLAMSPKVLLLDEPTRGIDVGVKAQVQQLVDELADQGLGIVMVSSDLEELVEGADRVVVLRDGKSISQLRGDEVSVDAVLAEIAADAAEEVGS